MCYLTENGSLSLSPKGGSKRIGRRDIKISTDLDFSLSAFPFLSES
jgi:hypothetical protein